MCSTKALLAGDGDVLADILRNRVRPARQGREVWGWGTAYGWAWVRRPRAAPPRCSLRRQRPRPRPKPA
jgi:formate dehydrogenase iron-sulfur subunit